MSKPLLKNTYICWKCCKDLFLRNWIKDEGETHKCNYCSRRFTSVKLSDLANFIHEVLQAHYSLTPDSPSGYEYAMGHEWWRDGDSPDIIIAEMTGVSEEIANDIRNHLSESYEFSSYEEVEEDPYGTEACYEESGIDASDFQETWKEFCNSIKQHSRFFNSEAEEALDYIFEGISDHKTWSGEPIVRTIKTSDNDKFIYRARIAKSKEELSRILMRPDLELASPPPGQVRAGRMNAPGISVFYGGSDPETCIAELRPPVGGYVVVGKFELIRKVRLLDLNVLQNLFVNVSHFDPEYDTKYGRAAFLRQLINEISRPVLPDDEEFGYMPTQAVAEYLAIKTKYPIDGIKFPSTQINNDGQNTVLFHLSSRVERWSDVDDKEMTIDWGWETDDDGDNSITIWEKPQQEVDKSGNDKEQKFSQALVLLAEMTGGDPWDIRPATLRLNKKSIQCHKITSAKYPTTERIVSRFNEPNEEDLPF